MSDMGSFVVGDHHLRTTSTCIPEGSLVDGAHDVEQLGTVQKPLMGQVRVKLDGVVHRYPVHPLANPFSFSGPTS